MVCGFVFSLSATLLPGVDMNQVERLHQLQLLDSRMDDASRRLEEIEVALKDDAALRRAEMRKAKAEKKLAGSRALMRDIELEVQQLRGKIKSIEERLYSGKVGNPKELASLQQEIEATRRWMGKREDDLLEVMVATEEAEEALEGAQERLKTSRSEWQEMESDLLAEMAALKKGASELQEERPPIVALIEPNVLKTYESLRRSRGGRGVADVKNGVCGGCGVSLPTRLVMQARVGDELFFCGSCGRILYVL